MWGGVGRVCEVGWEGWEWCAWCCVRVRARGRVIREG